MADHELRAGLAAEQGRRRGSKTGAKGDAGRVAGASVQHGVLSGYARGEVFYPSRLEPMSTLIATARKGEPFFDPLRFAVEECHKRGMELRVDGDLPAGER